MKRTIKYISIVLFGLILINTFSLALVNIHYDLNKEFIIENYCINIDKPELNCDGQCYLDELRGIISNNGSEPNSPEILNLNVISTEFFFCKLTQLNAQENLKKNFNSGYINNYTFLNTTRIEHPPIG